MQLYLNESKGKKENVYPCLKRARFADVIVLFTAPKTGVLLHGDVLGLKRFDKHDYFDEQEFEHYYGTVTLEND